MLSIIESKMQHNPIFYQRRESSAKCRINKILSWIFLSKAQDIDCVLVRQKESCFKTMCEINIWVFHIPLTAVNPASSCGHYDWKNPFKWSHSFQQQHPTSSGRKNALNHTCSGWENVEIWPFQRFGIKELYIKVLFHCAHFICVTIG